MLIERDLTLGGEHICCIMDLYSWNLHNFLTNVIITHLINIKKYILTPERASKSFKLICEIQYWRSYVWLNAEEIIKIVFCKSLEVNFLQRTSERVIHLSFRPHRRQHWTGYCLKCVSKYFLLSSQSGIGLSWFLPEKVILLSEETKLKRL